MTRLSPSAFRALVEAKHMDAEGLVSHNENPGPWTSGNGALDTSIYYIILMLTGALTDADSVQFERTISNLWSEGRVGLLSRNRGRPDQDAWDNYLGVCAASLLCDRPFLARSIRAYGESHCWIFQNEPGLKNLISGTLFRFAGLVPLIKMCANDAHPPSNIELAGLGWRLNEPADNPGSARTKWLMALCVLYTYGPTLHRSLRDAALFQLRTINNRYGSVRGMLEAYHGPAHPFSLVVVPTPFYLTKSHTHPVNPEASDV